MSLPVRRAGRVAVPIACPARPAGGMAVTLCALTLVSGQAVAVSGNGVVTPNHPDMAWLVQPI